MKALSHLLNRSQSKETMSDDIANSQKQEKLSDSGGSTSEKESSNGLMQWLDENLSPKHYAIDPPLTPGLEQPIVIAENDISKLGTTVRQVLAHPSLGPKFRLFAKAFHADEGIQFLDELAMVNPLVDATITSKQLMDKFFMDGAPCWVNLPNAIHKELMDMYNGNTFTSTSHLFEAAMYETFTDLKKSDTFRKFCLEDDEAKSFANKSDIVLLDRFITPETFRSALETVMSDPVATNLVRFCSSVCDFERSSEDHVKERKAKGQKIASTFVQSGSQFQITLPAMYLDGINKGNYGKVLADARVECLQILSKNEELMLAARKHSTMLRGASNSKLSFVSQGSFTLSATDGATRLQKVFAKEGNLSRELISKCVEEEVDELLVNKLRFLSATAQFMDLPIGPSKHASGRKIVSLFVQVGANFQVTDLGTGFVEDLNKGGDFNKILPILFQNVLSDMATVGEVVMFATDLLNMPVMRE